MPPTGMPPTTRSRGTRPATNLGHTCLEMGRFEEAVQAYRRALEMRTDDHEVWNNLGTAHAHAGRPEEAASCYGARSSSAPTITPPGTTWGRCSRRRGMPPVPPPPTGTRSSSPRPGHLPPQPRRRARSPGRRRPGRRAPGAALALDPTLSPLLAGFPELARLQGPDSGSEQA
jgi:tetratricopeptide (TPR) repeat protein